MELGCSIGGDGVVEFQKGRERWEDGSWMHGVRDEFWMAGGVGVPHGYCSDFRKSLPRLF